LFTLVLFALAAWIVSADRVRPTRAVWILPLMTVLWVNLHPGFALLFAYLGLVIFGSALEFLAGERSGSYVKRYAVLTALCGVASCINPFGLKLHAEVLSYFQSSGMTDLIQEFQSPTFRSSPQLHFMVFLFAGLAMCGLFLARKEFTNALVMAAFAYASLISVRHSTLFVIVSAPLIARELSLHWRAWVAGRPRTSSARVLDSLSEEKRPAFCTNSLWILAGLALVCVGTPQDRWPSGFDPAMFPVATAARHPELATARVFTTEQWADYLLYRNYPRQRVFYDDRSFYGEKMFRPVADLLSGRPGWKDFLAKFHTEMVLIQPSSPLSGLLTTAPDWKLVDQDKTAMLFARVSP
jgi:hypothetical protein